MRMLSDAFLTDLRQRLDIVDIVSEYVSLRRTGRNFVGLCPFHNERTPSFSVSSEKQFFHCFGCGASGNVIQFIMDVEGLPFLDAVKAAAARAGIEMPMMAADEEKPSPESTSLRQRMKDAHELAAKWYSYILMNTAVGVQALTYLETRGLTKTTLVQFRIGYAPDARQAKKGVVQFLQQRGFDKGLLIDSGIAVEFGGQLVDRFRARVMIPILDVQGAVVGFGGRAIPDDVKPKYLNSPETPIFQKSRLLFNQHEARKAIRTERTAILMEGYMDVISASQAGVSNAVASLGTSFSAEQAALLKRHATKLIIAYDGDNAGVTAARRALAEATTAGLDSRVLILPDGADPDELIRNRGADVFRHHLSSSAITPVQFGIYGMRRDAELQSVAGQQSFIRNVLSLLAERASPIEIETEIRQLSMEFPVSVDSLKEELSRVSKNVGKASKRRTEPSADPPQWLPLAKGHVLAGQNVLHAMMTDHQAYQYLLERGIDELATPEQTALLALGYGFRAGRAKADATDFVDSIEDEELRRLAIRVLMTDDAPVPTKEILNDYLRTIDIERVMAAWRVAIEQWKQAQLRGDANAVVSTKSRMDALADELQRLKTAPGQSHSG